LRRNALVAAGNVGTAALTPVVEIHARSRDGMLADAASWALGRMAERAV
jgi:hypothetical protein